MLRPRLAVFVAAFLALVLALYFLVIPTDTTESGGNADRFEAPESSAEVPSILLDETAERQSSDSDTPAAPTNTCLSPEQLETHPMFAADHRRLDSVAVSGPTISSYRGLSSAELLNLAKQNDSAAMAVLGAVSLLKARGLAEDLAVPYLLVEDPTPYGHVRGEQVQPEKIKYVKEAYDWFYKSALHGRLLALPYAGEAIGLLKGGAVGLGWIDKAEYDALRGFSKSAYMPETVYNALAFEIAPQLRDGPSGVIYELLPRNDWQSTIVANLAERFEQDRISAKLPPIEIAESTAPSMEEVRSMLCESYLDSEVGID